MKNFYFLNPLFNLHTSLKNHVARFFITIFLTLSANQAFAVTYTFSDAGVSPSFGGCSRTGAGVYVCTNAVTLTGNDSIVVTGTLPARITFNSSLSLQFINETTFAKVNSGGSASNLNLIVNGALSIGKKVIIMANIQAGSVSDTGGDVVFGGSINTTTGNIAIGYSSDITGSITSTSGQINLFDRVTVGGSVTSTSGAINFPNTNTISGNVICSTCTFTLSGLNSRINGTTQVGILSDNSNFNTPGTFYGGSINTLTGSATIGSGATVYGNITSNNADITVKESANVVGEITVKNASSTNYIRINQNAIINGSIYTNSTSTTANLHVNIENAATVNGSIIAFGRDYTYVNLSNNATVNGDVTAFGDDAAIVTLNGNSTINGHVKATSVDNDDGDVDLQANARVTGNVTAFGDIDNYGQINGCAHSTFTSGGDIRLRSGSSNSGGSCCGSIRTSCNSSCVNNSSGFATTLCQSAEAIIVNARGESVNGVWPIMELWVNQVKVDTVVVNSITAQNYTFYANLPATAGFKLDLVFPNDAYIPPSEDRNLYINSISYRGKTILSTDASVTRDYGDNSTQYFDGITTQGPGDNLWSNGAIRFNTALDATLIANYLFDELSWSGNGGEVKDNTSNNHHGRAAGTSTLPNTAQATRAIPNSPGTCGYGDFTGASKAVILPSTFPKLRDTLTISAWVRFNSISEIVRIFIDGETATASGGYALKIMGDRRLGFHKNKADGITNLNVYSNTILNPNQWYFVAAVMNSVSDTTTLYIYDQNRAFVESKVGGGYDDSYTGAAINNTLSASIGGQPNYSNGFNGLIDEVRVYSSSLNQTEIEVLRDSTHLCPAYVTNVNASSFNCIATQESTSGTAVSTGRLYTQLVNTPFAINVVALKSNGTAETSFSAASNRTAVLRFKDQISNSLINFSGGETANSKNVLFTTTNTTGIVSVTGITIPQAYKNLRCEISEASVTTPSASSDNFAVRPTTLAISHNLGSAPYIAGNNFTITATGGAGYDGAPLLYPTRMNNVISADLLAYTLTNTSNQFVYNSAYNIFTAGNGAATLELRFHDVGSFSIETNAVQDYTFTAVDDPNDCQTGKTVNTTSAGKYGCGIGSTPLTGIGRFRPNNFTTLTNTLTAGCSADGFTYMNQANLSLNTVIAARGANSLVTNGGALPSYNTGTLTYSVRNGSTNIIRNGTTNITDTPNRLQKAGIIWTPTSTWTNGALTLSETTLSYARLTTPDGPYDNLNVNYSISDSLGDNIAFTGNAFTNDTKMRYGRLIIQNNYGSELLPLSLPIEAQYWDTTSSTYRRNQLDNCTTINPVNITMGNYKNNLASCETQLSVASTANTTTMVGGKLIAKLTKPGTGNNGSVDLTVNTNTATGTTCIPTSTTATSSNDPWFGLPNPAARANFGLSKSPVIYMRENY